MPEKIIEPIYQEWWKKGSIVAASKQHEHDIRLAFYVGWFASMGMTLKIHTQLDGIISQKMSRQMMEECKRVLYDRDIKVKASIDGQPINNN